MIYLSSQGSARSRFISRKSVYPIYEIEQGSGSNLFVKFEQTKGVTTWSLFVVRKIDRSISMPDKMKFDYYYGSDAEQFTFIRLQKMLFTEDRFKKLSSDAKNGLALCLIE